jgi:2-polyprenyl-3-methyl-5-hydroxy-6-metoxy-1,4-benzoquinol methylase
MNEIIEDLDLKIRHQSIKKLDKIDILIAGCGTGQQVVSVCSRYRNSNILAIDLSLNSLAYAKRKTSELGYNNVEFMLIDILDLAMLNKKFDLIESCGVLHHMEDPIKGWQVLEKCLHPEGLMKIGLYSDIARRYIKDVREHIAIKNIPLNFKNIKSFREEIKNSQERHNKNIFEQCDAYTLSNFRDLLFHVQEHRFKISQIEKSLKELNLEFSGFEIGKEVFNKFKSINFDREDVYNLKKWEVFEERYPDTFIGMYQFYCQKS